MSAPCRFANVIADLKWIVSLGQRARTSDVAELHAAMRALEDYDEINQRYAELVETTGRRIAEDAKAKEER